MVDDFYNSSSGYKPLPSNSGYNPDIYGTGKEIVYKKEYDFYRIGTVLFFITITILAVFGAVKYLNLIEDGKFQSNINQPIDTDVNNNITLNPKFENHISNDYDIQLNVTVKIDRIDVITNSS